MSEARTSSRAALPWSSPWLSDSRRPDTESGGQSGRRKGAELGQESPNRQSLNESDIRACLGAVVENVREHRSVRGIETDSTTIGGNVPQLERTPLFGERRNVIEVGQQTKQAALG
jgi:hypothetical protein